MIKIEQINQEIKALPEEAQLLLIDFIQVLKSRYSQTETENINNSSVQEKAKAFREWAESHKNKNFPHLSDEDISRDSIYGERG
jgi:hypothetical protein